MQQEEQEAEARSFARVVSVLKTEGFNEAPQFGEALRVVLAGDDQELKEMMWEYPDRDKFESLLFLYWAA